MWFDSYIPQLNCYLSINFWSINFSFFLSNYVNIFSGCNLFSINSMDGSCLHSNNPFHTHVIGIHMVEGMSMMMQFPVVAVRWLGLHQPANSLNFYGKFETGKMSKKLKTYSNILPIGSQHLESTSTMLNNPSVLLSLH